MPRCRVRVFRAGAVLDFVAPLQRWAPLQCLRARSRRASAALLLDAGSAAEPVQFAPMQSAPAGAASLPTSSLPIPSTSNSKLSLPIAGRQASSVVIPAPASVERFYLRGEMPPLSYLTNEYCARGNSNASRDLDQRLTLDGATLVNVSKELSYEGDKLLGFQPCIPVMLPYWRAHFDAIMLRSKTEENFAVLAAYDAVVRRQQPLSRLDPRDWQELSWSKAQSKFAGAQATHALPFAAPIARPVDPRLVRHRLLSPAPFGTTTNPVSAASSAHLGTPLIERRPAKRRKLRADPTPGSSTAREHRHQPLVQTRTGRSTATRSMGASAARTVPPPARAESTGAPSVGQRSTTHRARVASSSDFFPVVTPLVPDAWEEVLRTHGLLEEFADVVTGLREGFHFGIHSDLSDTYLPPNHRSAIEHPDIIDKAVAKELMARRYTGPFHPTRLYHIIGNHRSSPLGVVAKAGETDEFRMIEDFSSRVLREYSADLPMPSPRSSEQATSGR
uniref:Uncharacterized protein n=1 Tax=Mycena chlorophos TaxID=658473 RepID=A0ABQ0LIW7_MYCCL|nr:predicted protein [Mycena chlorophos]